MQAGLQGFMNLDTIRFMVSDWLLLILIFLHPLIVIGFNYYFRCCIPCKKNRKCFLMDNDYVNKLLYLLMPLLVLHLELLLLHTGYPFDEINSSIIIILVVLQVYLFGTAVFSFFQLFGAAKKFGKYFRDN